MWDNENINDKLNNFSSFFGQLAEEFTPKDSYQIYRDKAFSATDPIEAINFMKKSVAEGRKYISDSLFEEHKGKLWLAEDGRPFMESKKYLAQLYKNNGYIDLCINEYSELLKLDTYDHLDIKSKLSPLLINEKRYEDFHELMDLYDKDESLSMLYSKALYYFYKGDNISSKRFIKKALDTNLYVAEYMILMKKWDKAECSIEEEKEALEYCEQSIKGWALMKDGLYWIMNEYFNYCSRNKINLKFSKETATKRIEKFLYYIK